MWRLEMHSYTVCIELIPADVSAVQTLRDGSEKQNASSDMSCSFHCYFLWTIKLFSKHFVLTYASLLSVDESKTQ